MLLNDGPSKVSIAEVAHDQPRGGTLVTAGFPTLRSFRLGLGSFSTNILLKNNNKNILVVGREG